LTVESIPYNHNNAYSYITIFTDKVLIEELLEGFCVPYKTLKGDLEEKESTSSKIQHREDPILKSSGRKPKGKT